MRQLLLLPFLLTFANAGDYYSGAIVNTYDPASGLYFRAVEKDTGATNLFSSRAPVRPINIGIFDPRTGKTVLLFKDDPNREITHFLFEAGFKDNGVEFYPGQYNYPVMNNFGVHRREPKDKLLIGVWGDQKKETILFIATKSGTNLKELAHVRVGDDWHVDVKNSKVRVVHQSGHDISIESYDW